MALKFIMFSFTPLVCARNADKTDSKFPLDRLGALSFDEGQISDSKKKRRMFPYLKFKI
jgi:hypothetical protein